MKVTKFALVIAAMFGLGACAGPDVATRSAPIDAVPAPLPAVGDAAGWHVVDVRVTAPRTLLTTEADVFYPMADLVWHGDPVGDRYQQVEDLMSRGLRAGVAHLHGQRPVYIDVTVERFHALTPKTRATVGGVHNMVFQMVVTDAETGVELTRPANFEVDVKGYGGLRALKAERRGETQKIRIMAGLRDWIQAEMGGQSVAALKTLPEVTTIGAYR